MNLLRFFIDFLLPSIGFLLALALLAHILRQRRSPSTTLSWLMAIVFMPYIGVPLYIMFGGRKISRITELKQLPPQSETAPSVPEATARDPLIFPGGFPATKGNKALLLTSGNQAFRRIMALIRSAESSIHITTFILGRDATGFAILEALAEKARGGIRVYLLLDALGCMPIGRKHLQEFKDAGGRVAFFMPMVRLPFRGRANLRNHRKMVLVDCSRAIVGGRNLAAHYMGPGPEEDYWLDFSMQIEGPSVSHIYQVFRSDWQFAAGEKLPDIPAEAGMPATLPGYTMQFAASGPDVPDDSLRDELLAAFFRARHRIWIMTPYFVPDDLTLEALCIAAKRGIDLRLVVPRRSNHRIADLVREAYLSQLQEAGGQIMLFQPKMIHAKVYLIDDRAAVTGSINMDMRSLLLNYEVVLSVYSNELINQFETWMQNQMTQCSSRTPKTGKTLGIIEGMGRLVAPLL